jgi:hypothetical protein
LTQQWRRERRSGRESKSFRRPRSDAPCKIDSPRRPPSFTFIRATSPDLGFRRAGSGNSGACPYDLNALFTHVRPTLPRYQLPRSARPTVPTRRARRVSVCLAKRLGGFGRQPQPGRANGDVSKTCIENSGLIWLPKTNTYPNTRLEKLVWPKSLCC